jgi:allantoinase
MVECILRNVTTATKDIVTNNTRADETGADYPQQTIDIAIDGGKIVGLGVLEQDTQTDIDAKGLLALPGVIDPHVHFNDPGRDHWEGIYTGCRAFVSGGGTLYGDMPLNASPPTLDKASFEAKLAIAKRDSISDFALWGGLTPNNLEHLPELAECGVFAFKAFMSTSGTQDFQAADDMSLFVGMQTAAQLGLPVAVHAESDALTAGLAQQLQAQGKISARDYAASRPVFVEIEAIRRAISLAEEAGCQLHIVHVSSGAGVLEVAAARARGVNVSCETCAHYLHFSEEDMFRFGAILKCAPPLRSAEVQAHLWERVTAGDVDFVTSDHSPSDLSLKEHDDFFAVWGGIAGVEATLLTLVHHAAEHGLTAADIARLTSTGAAKRFQFANKGRLQVGFDADITLVDTNQTTARAPQDLFSRHQYSPYTTPYTAPFRAQVVSTFVRGQRVFHKGTFAKAFQGNLVTPAPKE